MVQRYVWLAQMLLVTLAVAVGAHMATSYIGAKLAQPVTTNSTQTQETLKRQTEGELANYQVIVTRNIFNANPPSEQPPAPKPPPVVPQVLPATPLRLILAGTAVTGPHSLRYAIIEDLSKPGEQAVYQIGDVIGKAWIVAIRRDCVVLDHNGQRELLCLARNTGETQVIQRRPPASSPLPLSPTLLPPLPSPTADNPDIVQVDATTWRVRRDLFFEQLGTLGESPTQARLLPHMVQGQSQGLILTRLRGGNLLQQVGLQNGDVLQKVNGVSLTSSQEVQQAFQQLQNEATIQLDILRRNSAITFTYELR